MLQTGLAEMGFKVRLLTFTGMETAVKTSTAFNSSTGAWVAGSKPASTCQRPTPQQGAEGDGYVT